MSQRSDDNVESLGRAGASAASPAVLPLSEEQCWKHLRGQQLGRHRRLVTPREQSGRVPGGGERFVAQQSVEAHPLSLPHHGPFAGRKFPNQGRAARSSGGGGTGSGLTVTTTSSLAVCPVASAAVNRNVLLPSLLNMAVLA